MDDILTATRAAILSFFRFHFFVLLDATRRDFRRADTVNKSRNIAPLSRHRPRRAAAADLFQNSR